MHPKRLVIAIFVACQGSLAGGCADGRQPQGGGPDSSGTAVSHSADPVSSAPFQQCDGICLRDTAFGRRLATDPGWAVEADWLLFLDESDTVSLNVEPSRGAPASVQVQVAGQQATKSSRHVMSGAGVLMLWNTLDPPGFAGDTIPYTLRVIRRGARNRPALRMTGTYAFLTLEGQDKRDRFSIIPFALRDSVAPEQWGVPVGRFRVALVPDSTYQICRLPCVVAETIRLTPGARVLKRY